jgi:hypothetical protein
MMIALPFALLALALLGLSSLASRARACHSSATGDQS